MSARKVIASSSKARVTTSLPNKPGLPRDSDYREEEIEHHIFTTAPATVTVSAGTTKSMGEGSYEFVRIDVSISMPCYAEEVDDTYTQVSEKVWGMLDQELDNVFGQ